MKPIGIALALVLAGCGDVCDHAQSTSADVQQKGGPCNDTVNTFNHDKCEKGLSSCTSNDLQVLNNLLNCLDNLSTCSPATKNGWEGMKSDCDNLAGGVTLNCLLAVTGT